MSRSIEDSLTPQQRAARSELLDLLRKYSWIRFHRPRPMEADPAWKGAIRTARGERPVVRETEASRRQGELVTEVLRDILHGLGPLVTQQQLLDNRGELSRSDLQSLGRGPGDFGAYTEEERAELRALADAVEYPWQTARDRYHAEEGLPRIEAAVKAFIESDRNYVIKFLAQEGVGDENLYARIRAL